VIKDTPKLSVSTLVRTIQRKLAKTLLPMFTSPKKQGFLAPSTRRKLEETPLMVHQTGIVTVGHPNSWLEHAVKIQTVMIELLWGIQ
jgi:hypothetical protein